MEGGGGAHDNSLYGLILQTIGYLIKPRISNLGPKWVRLVLNGINPGLYRSDFSPEFIPFGAKLTYFGPKSDIPDLSRPQKANFIMSLKRLAHNL